MLPVFHLGNRPLVAVKTCLKLYKVVSRLIIRKLVCILRFVRFVPLSINRNTLSCEAPDVQHCRVYGPLGYPITCFLQLLKKH